MKKIYLTLMIYFLPFLAFARDCADKGKSSGGGGKNPDGKIAVPFCGFDDMTLTDLLQMILGGITYISIPILVIAFVYAGFTFVSAQGNSTKLENARRVFGYTVIAALIILGSNVILELMSDTAEAILKK